MAAHRDGFFRGLKDVKLGETIDVESLDGTLHFIRDTAAMSRLAAALVIRPRSLPIDGRRSRSGASR